MDDWLGAIDTENYDKIDAIAEIHPDVGAWLATAYDRDPNYYAEEVQRMYDYLFLIKAGER